MVASRPTACAEEVYDKLAYPEVSLDRTNAWI